jgi:hypothetical protein
MYKNFAYKYSLSSDCEFLFLFKEVHWKQVSAAIIIYFVPLKQK